MMKQKITFKLCLAMLGLLLSFSAGAANKEGEVTIDLLKYTLYDDATASVVAADKSTISGEIVILESVNNNKSYSVTTIGNYAFNFCSELTAITIPNSVTTIGDEAFGYCSKLTAITIPNSVTTIGNYAFNYCSGLTAITIPNSVTTIGYKAFSDCYGLTTITIPNSVTTIGDDAFNYCSKLQEIKVYVEEPITINEGVFEDVNYNTCKLYVPQGSIDKYQAANIWKLFSNILALADGSAIEGVDEDKLNVYSVDGKVVIKNLREGEAISICNTTGQNVYQGNETEVPLSKGIYFVKVGTIVSKVMVQ